ncbi:MAG: hypothetical protein CVV12_04605 [Gammaproteobacteria bacterium HGW-Gammaproteobacteria-2]|jgi:hypothetical protein|nr:MAG: hypothetical protein CVV12_04605 [Gammaproteobacteria bacterium HGW-Gammaproteobacteria-2]
MRNLSHHLTLCAVITGLLVACAGTSPNREQGRPDTAALAAMLREQTAPLPHRPDTAVSGLLGSRSNPVRVYQPQGEREYLHRLRCDNGTPPTYERVGSVGFGPYGRMLDAYRVQCSEANPTVVYMDMYHCEEETQPIPGFSQAPEIGVRPRSGCPN